MILRGVPGPSASTAERVQRIAQDLGYRSNRSASQLASRRTYTLGVTLTPTNPYHGELVEVVLARARERGYDVVLAPVSDPAGQRPAVERLVDSRCEAVLLLNSELDPDDLADAAGGLPVVCIGRTFDLPGVDVVRVDEEEALDLLVGHLASLGHRGIVHVDGGAGPLPTERRAAYEKAMRARGLCPRVVHGGESTEAGGRAAIPLLGSRDVTALVAYNDPCALGVLDVMRRGGVLVPDDVSVTGFDDAAVASLTMVDLTTIDPATRDQAGAAVDLALERLDGGRTERSVHVARPRLVARGTTGPRRSDAG